MQDIPYGYCHCGCGQKTTLHPFTVRKLGYVAGEPRKYIRNHDKRTVGTRYRVAPETGCWIFTGHVSRKGYGQMRKSGDATRMYPAHRIFYEQAKGPIPPGKQLDHLCRNRACVNPEHLEVVTNFENQRRGRKPKLTEEAIREIRAATPHYGYATDLARKFDVNPSTIHRVRSGRSWNPPT
jgi:hypothetical protein